MTMRDHNDQLDVALSLVPAARVNGTFNGTGVDLRGYDSAMLVVSFGAYTDGAHTPSLQHSDDNSSFTTVAAAEITAAFTVVNSAGGANSTQRVGYLGSKRYVRALLTVTGATTGALSDASVVRGTPRSAPLA